MRLPNLFAECRPEFGVEVCPPAHKPPRVCYGKAQGQVCEFGWAEVKLCHAPSFLGYGNRLSSSQSPQGTTGIKSSPSIIPR